MWRSLQSTWWVHLYYFSFSSEWNKNKTKLTYHFQNKDETKDEIIGAQVFHFVTWLFIYFHMQTMNYLNNIYHWLITVCRHKMMEKSKSYKLICVKIAVQYFLPFASLQGPPAKHQRIFIYIVRKFDFNKHYKVFKS